MSKKFLIIILIAVVVIGAAAYFLLFKGGGAEENSDNPEAVRPAKLFYYAPGESFAINMKDSNRMIKLGITLELAKNNEKFLTDNTPRIREVIIAQTSSMTEEELRAADAMEVLRAKILVALRDTLQIDYLYSLSFSDFVMN